MAIVYLCGLPGSGKSTIGPLLAKLRGQPFIDLDTMIAERAGMDIPAIFRSMGETKFRDFESLALVQAASRGDSVIALGGGALEREDNRDIVLASGMLIHLEAPLALLAARTMNHVNRPLLDINDSLSERLATLKALNERRRDQYELAPLSFPTTDEDPMQTALMIFEAIDGLI
ncbi:MAG: shikimate kinase AroK [bacterium]|nr:shikimate kinase AroK [bacterium]